jgi:hypothetical protein
VAGAGSFSRGGMRLGWVYILGRCAFAENHRSVLVWKVVELVAWSMTPTLEGRP